MYRTDHGYRIEMGEGGDLSLGVPGFRAYSFWSISLFLLIPPMSNLETLCHHIHYRVL